MDHLPRQAPLLRVAHVTTGLEVGGAEMMLLRLLQAQRGRPVESHVYSLAGEGPLAEPIRKLGIPVTVAARRGSAALAKLFAQLAQALHQRRFDVVQAWMYHANLASSLAAVRSGVPVVWSLHTSIITLGARRPRTVALIRGMAPLSYTLPARIISCSESSRKVHEECGYSAKKMVVVPNGFDTSLFKPDADAAARVRQELGLGEHVRLAGIVARFHPLKNHAGFFEAARSLVAQAPDVHFVLCGRGVSTDNAELMAMVDASVRPRCHFLGPRGDVESLVSGLDFLISPSKGEAFPLALGEAMATGVPCVATDVGDSALIVGDTGLIVPPGDSRALSAAILKMLALPASARRELGQKARARVVSNFDMHSIAARYEAVHRAVVR